MNQPKITFIRKEIGAENTIDVHIPELIIAGWTGSDEQAVNAHIEELAAIGIPRPATVPIYYRVAASRLTAADSIQVSGPDSSGEAEAFMVMIDGRQWVGCGSDHTDRQAETHGITLSKQMCDKPIGKTLWAFDDVKYHWSEMILRAYAQIDGERVLYQEGTLAAMRSPEELIGTYTDGGELPEANLMFLGTLAAIGGIRPADRFEVEIEDPVLKRKLEHGYDIVQLPVAG